jgi:hypothetical protein
VLNADLIIAGYVFDGRSRLIEISNLSKSLILVENRSLGKVIERSGG